MWYEIEAAGLLVSAVGGWLAWSKYLAAFKKREKLADAMRKKRAAFAVPEVEVAKRRRSPSFGRR